MHFVITFAFLVPMKSESVENDEGKGKGKVNRKRKQWRKKKIINKDTYEIAESKQNIINVGQVLAEIHCEYELLPGYTFKFDCRCWKTAAKIYTENGDWCLRPVSCPITENAFWVTFSVHHVVHLNETQIKKFFSYVITYQMFHGRNKFCERAKKDKAKGFYVNEESIHIGQYNFLEIYPLGSQESASFSRPEPEPVIVIHETDSVFSVTTYLDVIPDGAHQCKFWKMIRKQRFPSESFNLESVTISTEVEQKPKSNNRKMPVQKKRIEIKKSRKAKHKIDTPHAMSLPVETLFSEMGAITCYTRTSKIPNVSSILIYTQCVDILSNKQLRMNLNSISIKLEQMSNFPDDIIIENGFNYLYAKILFVDRAIATPYYIPARTIFFEFVKCFLNQEFKAEDIISTVGTKFLTIEIIGVRITNASKSPISTSRRSNVDASVKISGKEEVLLGVTAFDVSDLLRGSWEIRSTGSLSHPKNVYCISTADRGDEGVAASWKNSPLENDTLTSFDTIVKIKVRVAYDLRSVQRVVFRHVPTLNRIFLILNDLKLVNDILALVSSYNHSLFCTLPFSNEDADLKVEDTLQNILTGFAIDCCDNFFIFLEGLSKGYLLQIWEKVAKLPIEDGCVFYNSGCVFLERLYEDFVPLGGVLTIKLSESLEVKLRNHGLYIGETGTTPKAKVTRRMGLMKLALTMKSLSQKCLFPNSSDIQAFIDETHENYFERSV
ncbi:uncharacterized protein LOC128873219 isoform X1 [Hylaeus volcanicus]|uniref:uncharacterized protein LOC128873219 isoform X1 n=1 Tax=Hylaeus volcanicus TaxID=313075 RepID=UPI0023B82230|nr:uncharacterized protein LOC128873219 isoform X1 [Hylaeus volcanicus]